VTDTELAKLLLKNTLFDGDPASPDTIWRAQKESVRALWHERAARFRAGLAMAGHEIIRRDR
jgi:hypothetical protein